MLFIIKKNPVTVDFLLSLIKELNFQLYIDIEKSQRSHLYAYDGLLMDRLLSLDSPWDFEGNLIREYKEQVYNYSTANKYMSLIEWETDKKELLKNISHYIKIVSPEAIYDENNEVIDINPNEAEQKLAVEHLKQFVKTIDKIILTIKKSM